MFSSVSCKPGIGSKAFVRVPPGQALLGREISGGRWGGQRIDCRGLWEGLGGCRPLGGGGGAGGPWAWPGREGQLSRGGERQSRGVRMGGRWFWGMVQTPRTQGVLGRVPRAALRRGFLGKRSVAEGPRGTPQATGKPGYSQQVTASRVKLQPMAWTTQSGSSTPEGAFPEAKGWAPPSAHASS